MRSSRASALVVALSLLFVVGNLWTTFNRSTIPLSFEGVVTDLEVRREKHPGIDDVFILHLSRDVFVIDKELATQIKPGYTIEKNAWSTDLRVNGEAMTLETSRDFQGMVIAMPLILVALLLSLRRRPANIESEGEPFRRGGETAHD